MTDIVKLIKENVASETKTFANFLVFEIQPCKRPTKKQIDLISEPLTGISKMHSIWINDFGDLKGSELTCGTCTVGVRCNICNEKLPKKIVNRKEKKSKNKIDNDEEGPGKTEEFMVTITKSKQEVKIEMYDSDDLFADIDDICYWY